MLTSLFKNKVVLLAVVGIALAGIVWYSFLRDGGAEPLLQTEDLTVPRADGDVVTSLLQLRTVSLSGTIFTDPVFISLKDFGSEIIPEPVGRPNPFAPLGFGVPRAATTSAATSTAASSSAPAAPRQGR